MKRLSSLLLAAVLICSLWIPASAANGMFDVGTVTAVTLVAQSGYTNTVRATDETAIAAFNKLVNSTKDPVRSPNSSTSLASIEVESGRRTQTFWVVRSGTYYYLTTNREYRRIKEEILWDFVATMSGFYNYSTIPEATVNVGEYSNVLPVTYSSYSYLKLDGKYYRPRFDDTAPIPLFYSTSGRLLAMPSILPGEHAGRQSVSVFRGDKRIWTGDTYRDFESYKVPDGQVYTVVVTVGFTSDYYKGDVEYAYQLQMGSPPAVDEPLNHVVPLSTQNLAEEIKFSIRNGNTQLGEAAVLRIKNLPSGQEIKVNTNLGFTPTFFREEGGDHIALLPISYRNEAGEYWVEVNCGGKRKMFTVNAADKQWQIQNLTVSETTAEETILSEQANAEYEAAIAPLRMVADHQQYWEGRFIMPCSSQRVTTQFGMIRYVNGEATSTRHGALDLAVPLGTTVAATGSGRVLYADFLQLTGNTVLIEHGYGLKSWYYHMNSLDVAAGDMVTQGQKIGEVGSTGFSTGPHLHFGMSVNNVFINPTTAIETDLFVFDKPLG